MAGIRNLSPGSHPSLLAAARCRSVALPLLKIGAPCEPEQDELSRCSTRPPSPSFDSSPVQLPTRKAEEVRGQRERYVLFQEVLGGGMTGIVQRGFDSETGRVVAIKRIRGDKNCHVRFVEISLGVRGTLSAEGYAPAESEAACWAGPLAHDPSNAHGAEPFPAGSLGGRVAVVRRGGGVSFRLKLSHALRGGAVGVLFVNGSEEAEVFSVGGADAPLPSLMLARADGEAAIAAALAAKDEQPAFAEVRTDVRHELAVCRRLRPHPQVAQVIDAWEDGGSAVLVMEFCRGGKATAPRQGPQGVGIALWLIKQMLEGVAHLHAHGICHRDIKPENMLLTRPLEEPGARLVLVDLSMASVAERMRVPCGSPRYAAPEVLQGRGYGLKRDVWSAGMVAHELLFRSHPFFELSDQEVVRSLLAFEGVAVERGGGVPEAARALLQELLQADPDLRPSAERALAHPCLGEAAPPPVAAGRA